MKTTILTLSAIPAYAWIGQVNRPLGDRGRARVLHRAAPLALVTEQHTGAGLCGYRFSRDQEWWRVHQGAVQAALTEPEPPWHLCGRCLYLGGWPA